MKSLYVQCSEALARLREGPPADQGGVFTDQDVVRLALREAWTDDDFKTALIEANNLCGQQFRASTLCRYGPVVLPNGTEDYARIASRIVYGDAFTGPDFWLTPNGAFTKLMNKDDTIARPGRRTKTVRNDLRPWDGQNLHEVNAKELQRQLNARNRQIDVLERRLAKR